jgi:hypothetical protein
LVRGALKVSTDDGDDEDRILTFVRYGKGSVQAASDTLDRTGPEGRRDA